MERQFLTFKANHEGEEKEIKVYKPSIANQKEAQKLRSATFSEAIRSKAILRSQLNSILRDRGLWDDEKEAKHEALTRQILDGEKQLETGGFKLSEARKLALQIKKWRGEMREMTVERSMMDNETAEGQSDNMAFNYLVSVCTYLVYNNIETLVYNSVDDYLSSSDNIASQAAQHLTQLMYGININNINNTLIENKFLLDYGFVDKELRLINKDGHFIDDEGRLIDEKGRYVDKDGNFVNIYGDRIDVFGNFVVEKKPFLDDDGQPVELKKADS